MKRPDHTGGESLNAQRARVASRPPRAPAALTPPCRAPSGRPGIVPGALAGHARTCAARRQGVRVALRLLAAPAAYRAELHERLHRGPGRSRDRVPFGKPRRPPLHTALDRFEALVAGRTPPRETR
jgi:hypothetical protein